MSTGMTLEQVRDQFDLPRLASFNKYSEKFPPSHVLIASYFGFGKSEPKPENNGEAIADLLSQIPMVQP